jgi:hypothetical protein
MPSGAVIQEERTDRNGTYKSLQSASAANANGIVWYRADYELHWLRKLRRESVKIGRLMKRCRTFKGYAELSHALMDLCERERILLRIPLPAAAKSSEPRSIPGRTTSSLVVREPIETGPGNGASKDTGPGPAR